MSSEQQPPRKNKREIFFGALDHPTPQARAAYLDGACGQDVTLRADVEALLQHLEHDSFLKPPADSGPGGTIVTSMATEKPGDMVGRYKLMEKIGEGGFGVVYVAEQREPVRRRVALKVIKLGMDTKEVIARFEAERQALAMMDHPNIAKVLEAGATDSGRPYFVMELVKGIPMTDYCDQHNLTTRERVDLFVQVCHAIQHAHQKGIIHRDIKPSNILVTVHDGVPVPKVIDFGIAKATEQRLTENTVYTALEQIMGTPAYMSPEQAEMSGLDIDTRSDIYSLGVLLYELLTGKTPFDPHELVAAGWEAMRRTIREKEPQRPSTRLTTMVEGDLSDMAKRRQTDAPKLVHLVRGDLDWIVMKCLEKDRTRRYETASGLASDLLRHVNNEPVMARPPSQVYRFQKLVRRNKLACAAVAAVALALLLGVVVSTWQAILAKRRLTESEAISKFLTEVFQSPDHAYADRTTAAAEMLNAAATKLDTELANQPERRAKLQATLGSTYQALGQYREAILLQEKVRDYYLANFGPEHRDTLWAMHDLASSYDGAGRWDEALKLREEVLPLRRKLLGPEHPDTLYAMQALAFSYEEAGRREEALKLREESLALRRKVLGLEDPETLWAMKNLADSYEEAGRREEAITLRGELLPLRRKLLGPEHPDTLYAMQALAFSYEEAGRREEALKLREESLALRRKVLGLEHPETLWAMKNLADSYEEAGRREEAITLREELLPLRRKVLGLEHPDTLQAMHDLASSYDGAGRSDEALKLREELLALRRKAADQGDADAQNRLGWIYAKGEGVAKDAVEAAKWYRKAAEQGDADGQSNLAYCYEQGWGVEKDLAEAVRWDRKAAEQGNADGQNKLGWYYEQGWGVGTNWTEAIKWFRKASEQRYADGQNNLAYCYYKGWGVEKSLTEAAKWYRKAAEQGNSDAQYNLGWMCSNGEGIAKDPVEAAKWYRKSAEQGNSDAMNAVAWELATSENSSIRDGSAAVKFAEKAVAATNRKDPNSLYTLAAAYAEGGQFDKAISVQQEALALPQSDKEKKDSTSRLKLYQGRSPYRDPETP